MKEKHYRLDKQIEARVQVIRTKYTTDGKHPKWSTTYGKNIKSNVIRAIKNSFDWSKLCGDTIVTIVKKLIDADRHEDAELKRINEEKSKLNYYHHDSVIRRKHSDMVTEKTGQIRTEMAELNNKTNVLKQDIAKLTIGLKGHKADEIVKDVKDTHNFKYAKKKAKGEYRDNCISDFKKVQETLQKMTAHQEEGQNGI